MKSSWPRIEQLYHGALERGAAEREAFLAEACSGDEELRREVQSLLGYESEAAALLEPSPETPAPGRLFDIERRTQHPLTHDGLAGWPI